MTYEGQNCENLGYEVIWRSGDCWSGDPDARLTVQWFDEYSEARDAYEARIPDRVSPAEAWETLRRAVEYGDRGWTLRFVELRDEDGLVTTSEISGTNQEVEAVRALEDFLPFPLPGDDDGEA